MADYTLNDLNAITAPAQDDILHIRNTSGLDKKITVANFLLALEPVGVIKMYDGALWVDNVTIPKWYACIAANVTQGCPDLVDQFIKGGTTATVLDTGGAATHTLGETEIPSHTHSIEHNHGAATTGSHKHYQGSQGTQALVGTTFPKYGSATDGTAKQVLADSVDVYNNAYYINTQTISPSVNLPAYTGDSDGGTGGGLAHNNEPQYYKLIYIRKCA